MLKKILSVPQLLFGSICLILGLIGLITKQNELIVLLILSGITFLYYYIFKKEGSIGDRIFTKIFTSRYGKIILVVLFILFILSKLIILFLK
jgi:hypothetical protein